MLVVLMGLAALAVPAPAVASSTPQHLWHAFPVGKQPLLSRSAQPTLKPVAAPSPAAAAGPHLTQSPGEPQDESISITFVQVLALTALVAAVLVLTPTVIIRRRLG